VNKNDTALHNLICSSLRGQHIKEFSINELQIYTHKIGIALHNIPHYLTSMKELPLTEYLYINELDPSGTNIEWGYWCKEFSDTINQVLPDSPEYIFSQA